MIRKVIAVLFVTSLVASLNSSEPNHNRLTRQAPSCGIPTVSGTGLIYNGESFQRGLWPWMVAMMFRIRNRAPKFFCGATLISDSKVITGKKCAIFCGYLFNHETD